MEVIDYDGWVLRDAELGEIAHYFAYHAEQHAAAYLDGPPDPDQGEPVLLLVRRAA